MHPSELLNLGGRKATPYIQQSEASECALACIAMIAGFHGLETDLIALRRRFELSLKGATLKQLMHIAEELGFSTRPLRGEIENLDELALPTILHWDLNHFVVLTKITRGLKGQRFQVHDPASGVKSLTVEEISRHFTGVALELVKSDPALVEDAGLLACVRSGCGLVGHLATGRTCLPLLSPSRDRYSFSEF
jgi:ATP-binding cassette, subfamily B, bacterial CvaB/MchF/RaxB